MNSENKKDKKQPVKEGMVRVLVDNRHTVKFLGSRGERREFYRRNKEKFGGKTWAEVKNQII